MLLILSEADDQHVPLVTEKLEERGIEYLWFAPSCFPSEAQVFIGFNSKGLMQRTLYYRGREYDLSTVTGVWNRRPGLPTADASLTDETHRKQVEVVCRICLDGLWELMDCRWLPSKPFADRAAQNKLIQLDLAAKVGFKAPETLVTNHPDAFVEFYAAYSGALISKPLNFVDLKRDGEFCWPYTHPIRRRDARYYQAIRHETVIFQPYISKQVELRVTVVGERVFAAEIASQQTRSTLHDWRHYDDPGVELQYQIHTLPDAIKTSCVNLVKALGLSFGAIDFILTPDGEYIFLEINSNGQWGWIEQFTGLPIADAIADWLTGCETTKLN